MRLLRAPQILGGVIERVLDVPQASAQLPVFLAPRPMCAMAGIDELASIGG